MFSNKAGFPFRQENEAEAVAWEKLLTYAFQFGWNLAKESRQTYAYAPKAFFSHLYYKACIRKHKGIRKRPLEYDQPMMHLPQIVPLMFPLIVGLILASWAILAELIWSRSETASLKMDVVSDQVLCRKMFQLAMKCGKRRQLAECVRRFVEEKK